MPSVDVDVEEVQPGDPDWLFGQNGSVLAWDWSSGGPDPWSLESVRSVRSSTYSRNVPVHACSMTTGTVITLESGLEHVLMMLLDRQACVQWLVGQPVLLTWGKGLKHFPDLLAVDTAGQVTLWDARPSELQDIDFHRKADLTAKACQARGWRYEVFGGLSQLEEVNLRWLATARRPLPWLDSARAVLREMSNGATFLLGQVVVPGADPHVVSALWHLAWCGELELDLAEHWDDDTLVRWAQVAS